MSQATWTVHTEVFEGPLDLLLYLVQRDGVDLSRLSMVQIADSYLEWIERMRELNLSVAADYLVMASTLVHLKSLDLLPRPPAILEDQEDPREAFARRLAEYKRYRKAADALAAREVVGRDSHVRAPQEVDAGPRPLVSPVDALGLVDLYYELLSKAAAPEPFHRVQAEGLDIEGVCQQIVQRLRARGGRAELGALLRALSTRPERVLGFLGVLEMARAGWLSLVQQVHLGPADVTLRVRGEVDFSLVAERVEVETG